MRLANDGADSAHSDSRLAPLVTDARTPYNYTKNSPRILTGEEKIMKAFIQRRRFDMASMTINLFRITRGSKIMLRSIIAFGMVFFSF